MSTALVTGAAGFVGMALSRALADRGDRVIAVVRDRTVAVVADAVVYGDVRDADVCRRVLTDYGVEDVYHLAAQAIVSTCAEDPVTAIDVAVMGTARLLQAARETARPIKVVVSTSDKVYGHAKPPYDESTPLDARHAYEVSKACQDIVARMFAFNYGLDVRVVRAVNIYGPGDPNDSRLIPRTAQRLLRGEPPLVHSGATEMRRQYVYIDDMVSALLVVCERGEAGLAYCVGSSNPPMSVLTVVQRMAKIAGVPVVQPEVRARDARFQEIQSQAVRDDALRALGWYPRVNFEEGIRRTLDWYRGEAR